MWNLADQNLDLSNFAVEHDGERYAYLVIVRATYTDAFVVVQHLIDIGQRALFDFLS